MSSLSLYYTFLFAVPEKKHPYSPSQVKWGTTPVAEYAVARLDDLLNWGRKVCTNFHFQT